MYILYFYFLNFATAIATTYYCKDKETINIEGETSGTIHTRASGASKYDNNVDCSWKINAGDGNKIHFKILSSNLEYTPPYTSCFTRDSLFLLSGNLSCPFSPSTSHGLFPSQCDLIFLVAYLQNTALISPPLSCLCPIHHVTCIVFFVLRIMLLPSDQFFNFLCRISLC